MLKIKKSTINDARIISLLGRNTFNEAFGHLFRDENDILAYLDKTFSVSKIISSLQKEENVFWVAFWNNHPVGYAKLKLNSTSEFINSKNTCQLQKIYVLKDFLSMKIGLKLQNTLLKEARRRRFKLVWLSVWEGNGRAIRFYEKNNFKQVGNHNFDIGKEKFRFQVMVLDLDHRQ